MSESLVPTRAHHWAPYSNRDELVSEICERLATGESLVAIASDSRMPGWRTVYDWRDSDTEIAAALARAREIGEEAIARDVLEIADNKSGDPQRDKLRVDTRMKLLAKFNPKRWGESTQLRHADADGAKLDTQPLVGELLSLMGTGGAIAPPAPRAPAAPRVGYRDVTPTAAPDAHNPARPVYRPREAKSDGVDDLV